MHRDIKPSNILFLEDDPFSFELVISDFGISTKTDVTRYLFHRAGTPAYCAPEVIHSKKN